MNWTAQFIAMKEAADELARHVEGTYGLFHDAAQGWLAISKTLQQLVELEMQRGMSRNQALLSPLIHGKGNPHDGGVALYESTLGEGISRCAPHGPNEQFLGNMCLVSIYSFWEDKTRGRIADALGITKDDVQSGLFSELAKLRHLILHAGGRADDRVKRFEVLKWFAPGDSIVIDREKLHEVVQLIRRFPDGLKTNGYVPGS